MVRVDFYEIAFKAENSTYSFELPAIPRIGEHLTVADGMGGFASQEVLDVQHVCFVGPNEFKGIRVLLASETSLVDYNDLRRACAAVSGVNRLRSLTLWYLS